MAHSDPEGTVPHRTGRVMAGTVVLAGIPLARDRPGRPSAWSAPRPAIRPASVEDRINGDDAARRIVPINDAPIANAEPRPAAPPLPLVDVSLIRLHKAGDRFHHANPRRGVQPLQVANRSTRVGRSFTQRPSSLFTSSEV